MLFQTHLGDEKDNCSMARWIIELNRDKNKLWNGKRNLVKDFQSCLTFGTSSLMDTWSLPSPHMQDSMASPSFAKISWRTTVRQFDYSTISRLSPMISSHLV